MFHTNTFASVATLLVASSAFATDLAVNGGFELGDTSGWSYFPTNNSTFEISNDANTGSFAARLFNDTETSAAIIKQANVGEGLVSPGDAVTISFWAKGDATIGGVQFAEFFTEIAGGGVSSTQILGGAPLFVTSEYRFYSFNTVVGPNASGGITLQLTATTGANVGSTSTLIVDDVVIDVAGISVPCIGDIADDFGTLGSDDQVSFGDFLALLGLIGPCPGGTPGCTGDIADDFGTIGGDGQVSFGDFLALLGLIGPCA